MKESIEFANWILKHANTAIDGDGSFCWHYIDSYLDSVELYQTYLKEKL